MFNNYEVTKLFTNYNIKVTKVFIIFFRNFEVQENLSQ